MAVFDLHLVSYRYTRTPILDKGIQDYLDGEGVGFATVEDACRAMLKIASDTTVNGMFERKPFYFECG